MWGYEPPVSLLLTLGRPNRRDEYDYIGLGIGSAHIEELIRLMMDDDPLRSGKEPDIYGQIHAWRALAQLRAEDAVLAMLDLLADNSDSENECWDDWMTEELPDMIGQIGPASIPITVRRLDRRSPREEPTSSYARCLAEVAMRFPETRSDVVAQLTRILESAENELPYVNGFILAYLLDLKAVEAMPAIEKAFATGNVDPSIAGDLADVKYDFGLGPQPIHRDPWVHFRKSYERLVPAATPTPKDRADARAKMRKAEKRQKKKQRKG